MKNGFPREELILMNIVYSYHVSIIRGEGIAVFIIENIFLQGKISIKAGNFSSKIIIQQHRENVFPL